MSASWTAHDTHLVGWALVSIALIVLFITRFKVHAFLALIGGAGALGLAAGLPAADVVHTFEIGFGNTLAGTGVLVGLGTMLGKMLADSGGADRIVDTVLAWSGPRHLPWAMAGIGMLLGIPLFFEVGVVLVMPVVLIMARRASMSVVRVGLPALAGLSVMHGLVPPHPGPLIAVRALDADLGRTMGYGLAVAIPSVIIAGPLYGAWIGARVQPDPPLQASSDPPRPSAFSPPSFSLTIATILLPVGLMLARASGQLMLAPASRARAVLDFAGDPLVAMLLAVGVGMFSFGYLRGASLQKVATMLTASLEPIGGIVLVIGAGGGFKQMLVAAGIGDAVAKAAAASTISPLLLGWFIAVAIRLATGSATVATLTASGLMAPIARATPGVNAPLLALAIGAGSVFLSHVNDAGFWLIKEYFGMTVPQTFATWSAVETLLSVVALVLILGLGAC